MRPDLRVQLVTDDDAIILLHYIGLVEPTDRFSAAAETNRQTDWADQYMQMIFRFDTGAKKICLSLNTSLFIARGRLISAAELEYTRFIVSVDRQAANAHAVLWETKFGPRSTDFRLRRLVP